MGTTNDTAPTRGVRFWLIPAALILVAATVATITVATMKDPQREFTAVAASCRMLDKALYPVKAISEVTPAALADAGCAPLGATPTQASIVERLGDDGLFVVPSGYDRSSITADYDGETVSVAVQAPDDACELGEWVGDLVVVFSGGDVTAHTPVETTYTFTNC